jgi:hypothetical protein
VCGCVRRIEEKDQEIVLEIDALPITCSAKLKLLSFSIENVIHFSLIPE